MLVLLVEDDEDYAEIIAQTVRRDGHDVVIAPSSASAHRFTAQREPGLAILDVVLPDGTGMDVCRDLRSRWPSVPVLFLSSMDRSADVVAGLEAGGDDYVTKPFHPSELLARVRALSRRAGAPSLPAEPRPQRIEAVGLELDLANQSAYLHGENLQCTKLEFDILLQMVRFPGQVLSHAFLSERVWGYKNVNDATLLKGHVSSIRQKIRKAGGNEEMIRTVHGVGYCFTPV